MTRSHSPPRRRGAAVPLDLVRGGLVGCVELVPGVSGGTVAMVVGIYERLVDTAGHTVSAALRLVRRDVAGARAELARGHWRTVVPVLVGMAVMVVVGAAVVEPLVEEHPVGARALFLGLVLASLVVPARLVAAPAAGGWSPRLVLLAGLAAAAAALLTGLPPATGVEPALPLVSLAAAVAICALVLPGVSGSFLLATVGLYQPTLAALNDRDLAYIGAFALGAAVGLASFVRLLQHLLTRHRAVTLAVMTGLMTGSLRALWPWQTDARDLLAPRGDALPVLALVLLGVALVAVLLAVEHVAGRGRTGTGAEAETATGTGAAAGTATGRGAAAGPLEAPSPAPRPGPGAVAPTAPDGDGPASSRGADAGPPGAGARGRRHPGPQEHGPGAGG